MKEYTITIGEQSAALGTAEELVVALDVLQGHHDREVLEQLAPHLPALVDTPRRLQNLLRVLAPEDQRFVIEGLGPALVTAVGQAAALRDMLAMLAEAQVEEKLLATLGAKGLRRLFPPRPPGNQNSYQLDVMMLLWTGGVNIAGRRIDEALFAPL